MEEDLIKNNYCEQLKIKNNNLWTALEWVGSVSRMKMTYTLTNYFFVKLSCVWLWAAPAEVGAP